MTADLIDAVTAAMARVARDVILPRYNQLAESDIRSKSHPADLVTVADEESERILSAELMRLLPASQVMGEEAVSADPSKLEAWLRHDPLWIVDPIDGTVNFVNGRPAFAVVVALVRGSDTVMGWIHDPLTGRTLWSERGSGAWTRPPGGGDVRMRVDRPVAMQGDALRSLAAAIYHRDLASLKGKFGQVMRQGSAAHDYWALADGRLQVLAYRRLKAWDHAAGVLIHAEAGGFPRLLADVPYQPRVPEQAGLLCAPTEEVWRTIKALAAAEGGGQGEGVTPA